ncbi:GIY-YIG nuclease family protein [Rhodococcus sp. Eu-32]|nr:GIY-YIG nuclease family protein [Rhodococcus sp. Eu-32]
MRYERTRVCRVHDARRAEGEVNNHARPLPGGEGSGRLRVPGRVCRRIPQARGDTAGAERLRVKLADAQCALDDVEYRAANIRAGHVYVISNMGAFGINMVKFGMTRRLEPMDRVRELGDASVPFRFDLHALFFADDAVSVEAELHRVFADRRVNQVNQRREFFYANPAEVLEALRRNVGEVISFTEEPEAEEYWVSIGKRSASF